MNAERENLRTDLDNWEPLTVAEVSNLFSEIPVRWGIAGGWALDLHLGNKTREHGDIDIVVFRENQQEVYEYLKNDWLLYKAINGALTLWAEGEYLETVNDIWVCRNHNSPWAFQLMLLDSEEDRWIYRREKTVSLPKAKLFAADGSGVPYLKPEIQLLYKAGSSQIRKKDFTDFEAVLPALSGKEKVWLKRTLERQFSQEHSWLEKL